MNLVTLANVTKQFGERILLDGVDLLINDGDRIGLIGVNGSGKTTLLRIIAGLEPIDQPTGMGAARGSLTVWGGVRIQYLPQDPVLDPSLTVLDHIFQSDNPQLRRLHDYQLVIAQTQDRPADPALQARLLTLTAEMERTRSWAAENKAKTILTRLGITQFETRVGELSGGQQKRVALAHALIDPADLLILDEPTNHIDADTVAWLEEYLHTVPRALLMVTHDRYFLDRVINRIVELDRRKLVNYSGNYAAYLEQSTRRHEQLAAKEAKRQALLRQELAWLRRGVMARGTKQKARRQRIGELQSLSYDRQESRVEMALAGRRLGKRVLEASNLRKQYGDQVLFADLDFHLQPGDRVGVIGPNGAGKSTLLNVLAGQVPADEGRITWGETVVLGYYDQMATELPGHKRVLDFINDEAPLIRTPDGERVDAAKMLEWFLFTRPEQRTYISSLSGGEQRRLYMLRTLVHRPNVLFLDEPTNDLDIQTLTVLESFLDNFQGALVVASHDRYFLDRTVDFLVHIENGQVSARFPGPFANYQRIRREQAAERQAQRQQRTRPEPVAAPASAGARVGLSWKETQELIQLEQDIARWETEQERLATAINAAGGDYARLRTLTGELEAVNARLETAMDRWLVLSEKKDSA
jgi:ATP-binding cassette subfamily F protein uup